MDTEVNGDTSTAARHFTMEGAKLFKRMVGLDVYTKSKERK